MTFREEFMKALPRQLEVRHPVIPHKLVNQAKTVKVKKNMLYSYAAWEASERLVIVKEYAAKYVGLVSRQHLNYQWRAVCNKLFAFDQELLEDFVIKVAADMRAYLILRHVSNPVIAIVGIDEKETEKVGEAVARLLDAEIFNDFMVTQEFAARFMDVNLGKLTLNAEAKREITKFARAVSFSRSPQNTWRSWETVRFSLLSTKPERMRVYINGLDDDDIRRLWLDGGLIVGLIFDGSESDGENTVGLPVPRYTSMLLNAHTDALRREAIDIIVKIMRSAVRMGHVKADLRGD